MPKTSDERSGRIQRDSDVPMKTMERINAEPAKYKTKMKVTDIKEKDPIKPSDGRLKNVKGFNRGLSEP